jgi:hypothetical protein
MLKLAPELRPKNDRAHTNQSHPELKLMKSRPKPNSMRVARILVRRSLAMLGVTSLLLLGGCGGSGDNTAVPNIYRK